MLAVRYHEHGGPEVLQCEAVETPRPEENEVLIRIESAGVNYADTVRRNGDYYPAPTVLPAIPGGEIAGRIEALGAGVENLEIGTRVFALINQGGYAQYAAAPARGIIPVPEGLDPVPGLALIVQGLTAALVLKDSAALVEGESILIQGAAGGVGILSVQLAKMYGAKPIIAAASSPEKRELVLGMGADLAVDYTGPNWHRQVLDATDGRGVHIVQAMTGGNIFRESFECLAKFGRMVVYGFASREPGALNPERLLPSNHTIRGFFLGDYFSQKSDLINVTLAELAGYVSDGRLRIHMGGAFPLSGAGEAHRLLEGRRTKGKLVILPWQND